MNSPVNPEFENESADQPHYPTAINNLIEHLDSEFIPSTMHRVLIQRAWNEIESLVPFIDDLDKHNAISSVSINAQNSLSLAAQYGFPSVDTYLYQGLGLRVTKRRNLLDPIRNIELCSYLTTALDQLASCKFEALNYLSKTDKIDDKAIEQIILGYIPPQSGMVKLDPPKSWIKFRVQRIYDTEDVIPDLLPLLPLYRPIDYKTVITFAENGLLANDFVQLSPRDIFKRYKKVCQAIGWEVDVDILEYVSGFLPQRSKMHRVNISE